MSLDATEMYLILPRRWHRAQHSTAISSSIGLPVVEESAIELRERQGTFCKDPSQKR